jgi:hypothetical protein
MVINANNPVGNPVKGLETSPKANEVRREKGEAPERDTARTEESPDYRISISDASKKAVAELSGLQDSGREADKSEMTESAAARLAQQTSVQLAQTDTSIANQAIAQAVDLFT